MQLDHLKEVKGFLEEYEEEFLAYIEKGGAGGSRPEAHAAAILDALDEAIEFGYDLCLEAEDEPAF